MSRLAASEVWKTGQARETATISAANYYALILGPERLRLSGRASLSDGLTRFLDGVVG